MNSHIPSAAELPGVVRNDLLSEVGADRRYPWRFLFVPTLWGLKPAIDGIRAGLRGGVRTTDVTSVQYTPDSIITEDDVLRLIRTCCDAGGPWIITGLSEVLRFKRDEEFETLVRAISDFENHGEDRVLRRLYIPLAGLYERFQQLIWRRAEREGSGLWPATWVVEEPVGATLQVLLLGQPLTMATPPTVANYQDFVSLCNRTPIASVVVTSTTVADLYDMAPKDVFPDAAVAIRRLSGYAQYVHTVLGVDVRVPYRSQDMRLWRQFTEDLQGASEPRLQNVLYKRFDCAQLKLADALRHWTAGVTNEYLRWLLRAGVCTLYPDSYLARCMDGLETLDTTALTTELLRDAILHGEERTTELLEERRTHLRVLSDSSDVEAHMPADLQAVLEVVPSADRLRLLTDTTAWERGQFIRLFGDESIPHDEWYRAVKQAFPVLFDYIEPYQFDGLPDTLDWVNTYFDHYRESRLVDRPGELLTSELARVNSSEEAFYDWYYAARNHDTADALVSQGTQALMVDGMGWEWVPFIVRRLHDAGLVAANLEPTAACLPTTTEFNRFDPRVVMADDSLDAVAHRSLYQYPQTLLEELELVRRLVDGQLAKPGTVVLADHGLTAFSRSVAGDSKYQMDGVEHEGRCAWLKTHEKTCSDFLVREVPPKPGLPSGLVALALGHTPLGSMGTHSAHGGATPEEVLVPTFIVQVSEGEQQYRIRRIVADDTGQDPRQIVFEVVPEPISAPRVMASEREIPATRAAYGRWVVSLPQDLVGSVAVDVQVEATTVTWTVIVKAGMKEKELFDE